MMRMLPMLAVVALGGCASHATKPVVILGNETRSAICECPAAAAERARAERWKAYAEKLEARLGIPHEEQQ